MFSWNDLIKVSKSLQKYAPVNSRVSEGFWRAAVSRAYYAVYHASLDYASRNGYRYNAYRTVLSTRPGYTSGLGSHAVLAQFLLDQPDTRVRGLGAMLSRCKRKRVECDYISTVTVDNTYVNDAFLQTDSIQTLIPTLP